MLRVLLVLACLAVSSPAAAHSLRVFATVVGDRVEGYGYFVGGGRPSGVTWTADTGGETIASGRTDAEGGFAFSVPAPVTAPVRVTIDAGDGHAASRTLEPSRFAGSGQAATPEGGAAAPPGPDAAPTEAVDAAPDLAAIVEAAVSRQVGPLSVRIEEMDARLRLTDVLSGLFFLLGLAGMALWALGRRR